MLEKLKEGYEKRAIGYFFSAAITVVALVLAIVYASSYGASAYISWIAFIALVVVFLTNGALFLLGKNEWSPLVSIVLVTLAVCFFIAGIYHYVSIVLVGIDIQTFSFAFITNAVLFVLLLALSAANIFLSQSKE